LLVYGGLSVTPLGVAGISVASLFLYAYKNYSSEKAEYHKGLSDEEIKIKYMIDTYGEAIKPYLEACKEEIKILIQDDLCLSLNFFWKYFSILDIMYLKSYTDEEKELNSKEKNLRMSYF
jgi:hypothetical protein